MAKQVTKVFKIMAPGGKATPAPPIGPALGANGVNPGQFITAFNERTKEANQPVAHSTLKIDRTVNVLSHRVHAGNRNQSGKDVDHSFCCCRCCCHCSSFKTMFKTPNAEFSVARRQRTF